MESDLILYNARIYTGDRNQPWAEAVACHGGYIVAVGKNEDILSLAGPRTERIDSGGQLVLPGLIDAHMHLLPYTIRQQQINLYGITDIEIVRQRVQQAANQAEPGHWIEGWGWDENRWAVDPHRSLLDDIAPHNPVVLVRADMHTWWLNGAALQAAGITPDTPDPPESLIERDPTTGELTGLLREWNAIRLVEKHIPVPNESTLLNWLQKTIAQAHQLGLTGLHDQRVEREGAQNFHLYQALHRQDQLKLRIHMNLAADYLTEIATIGLESGFGNDRLWLGHVKVFADGTLGSRTAYLLAPYENQAKADDVGLMVTDITELAEIAVQADQAGFPLSVHAIGDRAVREVIDILSEFRSGRAASRGLPHRIEHVQLIHPTDLPRLNHHGLVASVQPTHLMADWSAANRVWGERSRYAYAFRSLLDHHVRLAFGSDAPVAPLNPMLTLYAALTRQDEKGEPEEGWYPTECISLAEAIEAYTMGPAYASGKQARQGSITPGKWADMIMLSANLFEIAPEDIPKTQVDMTIFNGEIVYQR